MAQESNERFWSKVRKGDGCWRWDGYHNQSLGGRPVTDWPPELVYRKVWRLLRGPLDSSVQLHHTCRNPWCVNPAHLLPISVSDHAKLHAIRPTHCPHGHEYTAANSHFSKKGHRRCRECIALEHRKRYAKKVGRPLEEIRPMRQRENRKMYTAPWDRA